MTLQLLLCLWWDAELQWIHSSSRYFVIHSVLKGLGQDTDTGVLAWSTGMGWVCGLCADLLISQDANSHCKSSVQEPEVL